VYDFLLSVRSPARSASGGLDLVHALGSVVRGVPPAYCAEILGPRTCAARLCGRPAQWGLDHVPGRSCICLNTIGYKLIQASISCTDRVVLVQSFCMTHVRHLHGGRLATGKLHRFDASTLHRCRADCLYLVARRRCRHRTRIVQRPYRRHAQTVQRPYRRHAQVVPRPVQSARRACTVAPVARRVRVTATESSQPVAGCAHGCYNRDVYVCPPWQRTVEPTEHNTKPRKKRAPQRSTTPTVGTLILHHKGVLLARQWCDCGEANCNLVAILEHARRLCGHVQVLWVVERQL